MFLKKRRILLFFMMGLMFIMLIPHVSHANDLKITKEGILNLEKSELLEYLQNEGLVLPEYYENHKDIAENFVYYFTPLILNEKIDTSVPSFNLPDSNEMLKNLETVLINKGLLNRMRMKSFVATGYKLKDSVPIGSWNYFYRNYNCYAYSIDRTRWRQPNGYEGIGYDCSKTISEIANDVLNDLDNLGYWGYKTTTKPNSLPDEYFRVICVRKNSNHYDYHFMKVHGYSLDSWTHKPGGTQPLKWRYSSPGDRVWTNEAVINGETYEPTLEYDSEIYYIVYKGKNDPGTQIQRHMSTSEIRELFEK